MMCLCNTREGSAKVAYAEPVSVAAARADAEASSARHLIALRRVIEPYAGRHSLTFEEAAVRCMNGAGI